MPRGVLNKTTETTAPEPLIIVQPTPDGRLHLNAYELDDNQIIDMLRRTLLHLVATRNGARVIDLTVPAAAAVAIPPLRVPKATPPKQQPIKNRPGPKPAQRSSGRQDAGIHRLRDQDPDDEDLDDIDLAELMEAR